MRRQFLAWAAPLGAVVAVTSAAGIAAAASSTPDLPDRTPAEVLAAIGDADVTSLSGTIRTESHLGLPTLPSGVTLSSVTGDPGDPSATDDPTGGSSGEAGTSPASILGRLLSGQNTITFATDGTRVRIDLDDPVQPARVVADEDSVSLWSREAGQVDRYELSGQDRSWSDDDAPATPADVTPQALAEEFLDAAAPTTDITLGKPVVVAGRDAYTLEATPVDDGSLVERIRIAVDAATGVPLRFEVDAVGQGKAAFRTGFVEVSFDTPDDSVFADAFPADAPVVDQGTLADSGQEFAQSFGAGGWHEAAGSEDDDTADVRPTVTGQGWASVVEFPAGSDSTWADLGDSDSDSDSQDSDSQDSDSQDSDSGDSAAAQSFVDGILEPVDGGRVVTTALVTVLLTDDGRVLLGSVPVETLQAAAAA